MITVNALGDTCPIPVVKTKKAIAELGGAGQVETLVDNEIAVQNLTKMAVQKGYEVTSEKLSEDKFRVVMTIGEAAAAAQPEEEVPCYTDSRSNMVVAIDTAVMGHGDDTLGAVLMKGFIFALTQQDILPKTILFYNGGAKLTTKGSASLEDLKTLEALGVEILTCGTCLNHYGLTDQLMIGEVTNMYVIAEKMTKASLVVKP